MGVILRLDQLAFIFGVLGNIALFLVLLAPVPTFYKIYKKKSSEGYQWTPYLAVLMNVASLLYYGFLKNDYILISINGIGCAIEAIYLLLYIIYSPKEEKIFTFKLGILVDIGVYGIAMLLIHILLKGSTRLTAAGWICATFNLATFIAPLSAMREVIRTRSVEYMSFPLSLCLTLYGAMRFMYGYLIKDLYIALPTLLGFMLGIAQMILFLVYKDAKREPIQTESTMTGEYTYHMDQN